MVGVLYSLHKSSVNITSMFDLQYNLHHFSMFLCYVSFLRKYCVEEIETIFEEPIFDGSSSVSNISVRRKHKTGDKDKRMKATSETLNNMRILKLQGWKMKFMFRIFEFKNVETEWIKKFIYISPIINFIFSASSTFVSGATFGACMLFKIPIESGKILSALATFRILKETIYNVPENMSMIVQTHKNAYFLSRDELQANLPKDCSNTTINFVDGTFSVVDAHTGSLIFKEVMFGHLTSKTIIYVTHEVNYLPSADLILIMRLNT